MNQLERQEIVDQVELALQPRRMETNAKQIFLTTGAIMSGPFAALLTKLLTPPEGGT